MNRNKVLTSIFIALLLAAGFFYRTYMGYLIDVNPVFDQQAYLDVAYSIADGHMASDCCTHGPGYPLFLAGVFSVFGRESLTPVRTVQMILDTITAFLVYLLVKKNFSEKAGILSFLLYLFNPFTSSYTGMILAEALGCFLIGVLLFLGDSWRRKKSIRLAMAIGFSLAFFAITKYAFFYVSVLSALLFVLSLVYRKNWQYGIIFSVSFLAVFIYPVLANYQSFGKLTVMPPRSDTATLLYAGTYMGRYHELVSQLHGINKDYTDIMVEYYDVAKYHPDRLQSLHDANLQKFFTKVIAGWPAILFQVGRNIVWMWDKPYRVVNLDPLYPQWTPVFQGFNIAVLLSAFMGLVLGFRLIKMRLIWLFSVSLILFCVIGMSMLTNETRITIVLYPMLIFWAGAGIAKIFP